MSQHDCTVTTDDVHAAGAAVIQEAAALPLASMDEITAAFIEWDRRFRDDPTGFVSSAEILLHHTPETYGEGAAATLFALIVEARCEAAAREVEAFASAIRTGS